MGFEIISDVPVAMHAGLEIRYKVKPLMGVPLNWVSVIKEVAAPNFFIDEQLVGPYRSWQHQHWLKETTGGVQVIDVVEYVLPFGLVGQLTHWLFVKRQLNSIFDYRQAALINHFGDKQRYNLKQA